MIITELYNGQGLGNQLWCYVVTRLVAMKNNYEFGIMSPHKFKAKSFLSIDFGHTVIGGAGPEGGPPSALPDGISHYYKEKLVRHPDNGYDITKYDPNLFNIKDGTKLEGIMQSYDYVKNHKSEIQNWIHSSHSVGVEDEACIIHIRGGDFLGSTAVLFNDYYSSAMEKMKSKFPDTIFYIVTDDPSFARKVCPNVEIIGSSLQGVNDSEKASHHIGGPISFDYSLLNSSKRVIMSASSFCWWAVWTNKNNPFVIAPKYWAVNKMSDGYWSCGDSLVEGWEYLHQDKLYSYDECAIEKNTYENNFKEYWNV